MKTKNVILCALGATLAHFLAIFLAYPHGWQSEFGWECYRQFAWLSGTAGDPYQYRFLHNWIVSGLSPIMDQGVFVFGAWTSLIPTFMTGIIALSVATNFAIFFFARKLFEELNVDVRVGMIYVLWFMVACTLSTKIFALDTFLEIMFALLITLITVRRNWMALIPMSILAMMNRETILAPLGVLLIISLLRNPKDKPEFFALLLTIGASVFTFFMLRKVWPYQVPNAVHVGLSVRNWVDVNTQRGVETFTQNILCWPSHLLNTVLWLPLLNLKLRFTKQLVGALCVLAATYVVVGCLGNWWEVRIFLPLAISIILPIILSQQHE